MKIFFTLFIIVSAALFNVSVIAQQNTVVLPLGDHFVVIPFERSNSSIGTVISAGQTWMDRNLGASRVATSSTDSAAYGDLYQWGRLKDGHEQRTSPTTTTLSSQDIPGHNKFILWNNSPYSDWRNPQNNVLWQGEPGTNNPCPPGFRLPTEAEWEIERSSWTSNNDVGAFTSPLKLVKAGYRFPGNGSLGNVGGGGLYWSSTTSGNDSRRLQFNDFVDNASMDNLIRGYGGSVRCIQD